MWKQLRRWWRRMRLKPDVLACVNGLESSVKHLESQLARGSRMRQQTHEERETNPTTFGFARFPLTETQRKGIQFHIDVLNYAIGRIYEPESTARPPLPPPELGLHGYKDVQQFQMPEVMLQSDVYSDRVEVP